MLTVLPPVMQVGLDMCSTQPPKQADPSMLQQALNGCAWAESAPEVATLLKEACGARQRLAALSARGAIHWQRPPQGDSLIP